MKHLGSILLVATFLGALVSGCAASRIVIQAPHLNIDKDGYVADDTGRSVEKRPAASGETAEEKAVRDLMDRISGLVRNDCAANGRAHLLMFVHGGLVTTRGAMEDSAELTDSQVFLKRGIRPIYINWNSGLLSSMADDIFWIRGGQRLPEGAIVFPVVVAWRLAAGAFNTLPNWYFQVIDESRFFQKWDSEPRPSAGELLSDGAVGLVHAPVSIVSTPFFTGFGRGAWEMMSRRIDLMFAVQKAPKRFARKDDVNPGVMRTFLDALEAKRKSWDKTPSCRVQLDFVGHSMGALIGTRVLREYASLRFDRILFLAPASTVEDYVTTVPAYLERHPNARFYNFGLSIIDEGNELSWKSVLLPRGSLLVWIDNFFETAYSPEDYRLGDFFNETTFKAPLRKRDPRCDSISMLKVAGARSGRAEMPRKHGEFNDAVPLGKILDITRDAPTHAELRSRCGTACAVYNPCEIAAEPEN